MKADLVYVYFDHVLIAIKNILSNNNPFAFSGFNLSSQLNNSSRTYINPTDTNTWQAGKVTSVEYRVEEPGCCWYYGIEYDERGNDKEGLRDLLVPEDRVRLKAVYAEGAEVEISMLCS